MDNMHVFPHWLQAGDNQPPILEPEIDDQPPNLEQEEPDDIYDQPPNLEPEHPKETDNQQVTILFSPTMFLLKLNK